MVEILENEMKHYCKHCTKKDGLTGCFKFGNSNPYTGVPHIDDRTCNRDGDCEYFKPKWYMKLLVWLSKTAKRDVVSSGSAHSNHGSDEIQGEQT